MESNRAENIHLVSKNTYKSRKAKKMSQQQLAELSGISQGDISRLEANNVDDITIDSLGFLADALEKDVIDLFKK